MSIFTKWLKRINFNGTTKMILSNVNSYNTKLDKSSQISNKTAGFNLTNLKLPNLQCLYFI